LLNKIKKEKNMNYSKFIALKIPESIKVYLLKKDNVLVFFCNNKTIGLKINTFVFLSKQNNFVCLMLNKNLNFKNFSKVILTKTLILSILKSLVQKYTKKLNLTGVGFKVVSAGQKNFSILTLKLGYSHLFFVKIPKDIDIVIPKLNKLFIIGNSFRKVLLLASFLKSLKLPDSYKGKGFSFDTDSVILKPGKKV